MSDYVIAPRQLTADMATAMKSALFLDTAWTAALLASPSPVSMEEIVEVLTRLRLTSRILLQNAIGCAVQHHGRDPSDPLSGWLADSESDIQKAESLLSRLSSTEGKP